MITPLEEYILKVLATKMQEKKMTPTDLSLSLNKNAGFISKIFNPNERLKINMYHINAIARVFKCKMSDFFPDPYIEYDETKYKNTGKKESDE